MNAKWKNKTGAVGWLTLLSLLWLWGCGNPKEGAHTHGSEEVWTCPMHPQVVADKPGACPLCGMDLVKKPTEPTAAPAETQVYTCPMHPNIKSDKPGSCPVCGMDLVKKGGEAAAGGPGPAPTDSLASGLDDLLHPVNTRVIASVATVHPQAGAKSIILQLPGRVEYDPRRIHAIAARFAGRIEKLYVRYNYQRVSKGQKLMEIYSPQLVTAQQELLFLLTHDPENEPLLTAARQKLRLLGLSQAQIKSIQSSRQPQYRMAVYSPYEGYVVENPSLSASAPQGASPDAEPTGGDAMGGNMSASAGGGMASGAAPAPSGSLPPPDSRLTTTEGAYVTAGQSVFRVVNTERIWATFPVYAGQLPGLHLGTPLGIRAESQPDSLLTGKVDFIEPIYRQGRQTATIRAYLNNPGGTLRSGMLLRGEISFRVDTGLWLPRGAVLDLGNRSVAFRKESNTLRPVGVVTGFKTDEWVQIISGLSQVDAVAAHAQQLMDSEAFVLVNQPQP